jgi:hypothetical protein
MGNYMPQRSDSFKYSIYTKGDTPRVQIEPSEMPITQPTTKTTTEKNLVKVDNKSLKDGDIVYAKKGEKTQKFIFRGLRPEGVIGARSPRLEDADGEIVIPGENVVLYKSEVKETTTKEKGLKGFWKGLTDKQKESLAKSKYKINSQSDLYNSFVQASTISITEEEFINNLKECYS